MKQTTRRSFLAGTAGATLTAAAGCLGSDDADGTGYEVWALDQGTDQIYIYEPDGDDEFEAVAEIDVNEDVDEFGQVPHMVDFSSDYEYAAVACTAGAKTLVYRTEDRELVANLDTGAGSHFAGFTPDDEYIQVDAIGEGAIVRVDADLEDESFDIVDEIVIDDAPAFADRAEEFPADDDGVRGRPVCHDHANGHSYHTLGPSIDFAGVVVVDYDAFEIDQVFSPDEIRSNCGTMASPDEGTFYFTAGVPSNHEETGGVGEWYALDTDTNLPLDPETNEPVEDFSAEDVSRDTDGYDAHGFWFTDGGDELWILNRETDNGLVVDPETNEVIDEIDDYGPAPDIMWGSPDDEYMFVTLRGPDPLSGDPHAAKGETPGFSVLSVEDREIVTVIEPDEGNDDSDFHGIGVRVTE
ncbi:cell surface protein [Halobacteria archaeon AArc-curdl1]|uniref:Cell surface protein n=1 Tax=Natronosalvus hydrolyticus TaxID=2979988 RepID=A0AAP3E807_9EURY|nr:cell surface protein [Halobacteria archaeon AArc-curdl1]